MLNFLLAMTIALIGQNISEWFFHKYVLHGLGKKKNSFFHYHWEHHKRCRGFNDNIDRDYVKMFRSGTLSPMIKKELFLMVLANLVTAVPTYLFFWPNLGIAFFLVAWYYYIGHALSHSNNKFKFLMPWHRAHHQLKNQNTNWCVTFPWFDWIMQTRHRKGTYKPL